MSVATLGARPCDDAPCRPLTRWWWYAPVPPTQDVNAKIEVAVTEALAQAAEAKASKRSGGRESSHSHSQSHSRDHSGGSQGSQGSDGDSPLVGALDTTQDMAATRELLGDSRVMAAGEDVPLKPVVTGFLARTMTTVKSSVSTKNVLVLNGSLENSIRGASKTSASHTSSSDDSVPTRLHKEHITPAVQEALTEAGEVLRVIQKELLLLLEKDTLPRFKTSPLFTEYVEAEPLLFQQVPTATPAPQQQKPASGGAS
jgi:hypothetical protein